MKNRREKATAKGKRLSIPFCMRAVREVSPRKLNI